MNYQIPIFIIIIIPYDYSVLLLYMIILSCY